MVVSQRARKAEEECKQLQEQLATCEKERKAARSAAARAQGARSSIRTMAARTRQAEATAIELADRLEEALDTLDRERTRARRDQAEYCAALGKAEARGTRLEEELRYGARESSFS